MSKSDIKKITISILFFIISAHLVVTTITIWDRKHRLTELENEVITLQNTKQGLETAIEYKKTDGFVEEFARNELNMIKPGEEVLVVTKSLDDTNTENTATNTIEELKPTTPFKAWISILF